MIKKIFLFFASLFIGVGLLVWTVRMVGWQDIQNFLLIFSGWKGVVILFLTFLILFINLWRWQIILRGQGYSLSIRELFGPHFAGFATTYLFPIIIFGGEFFKSYVLREKFSIPWAKAMASVVIDRVLEVTAYLVTIFLGLAFFFFRIGLPPKSLAVFLGGTFVLVSSGISFFYFKSARRESVVKYLAKFFSRAQSEEPLEAEKEIFGFLKTQPGPLFAAIFLSFLRVGIIWLRCWLLLLFLGSTAGFLSTFSILSFSLLTFMVPIPAALGSHEAVQTFVFNSLSLGGSLALAFTMIQRGAELILVFLGVIVFFKLGMGLLEKIFLRKIDNLTKNRAA